jgi:ubiquinone/menaquinone biosynthesis C-methylase UbiE
MTESQLLQSMAIALREAFFRGENVMEYARTTFGESANTPLITLLAYDLQAGSYIRSARNDPQYRQLWCRQIASLLEPFVCSQSSLLEVGCGEATTLSGVINALPTLPREAFGFDISWSRCAHGNLWLRENNVSAQLFVADLFNIPLADASIDVVYTAHSLEPNGGREKEAIIELLRIARKAVVLIEPAFDFASDQARQRMIMHGYVRNLKSAAESLGSNILEYRPLKVYGNPLNPSCVLSILKDDSEISPHHLWRCPITHSTIYPKPDAFVATDAGLIYPVLRNIPLLRAEHSVVASAFSSLGVPDC